MANKIKINPHHVVAFIGVDERRMWDEGSFGRVPRYKCYVCGTKYDEIPDNGAFIPANFHHDDESFYRCENWDCRAENSLEDNDEFPTIKVLRRFTATVKR